MDPNQDDLVELEKLCMELRAHVEYMSLDPAMANKAVALASLQERFERNLVQLSSRLADATDPAVAKIAQTPTREARVYRRGDFVLLNEEVMRRGDQRELSDEQSSSVHPLRPTK